MYRGVIIEEGLEDKTVLDGLRSNPADYEAAKQYALSIGIPEHQLGFMPKR